MDFYQSYEECSTEKAKVAWELFEEKCGEPNELFYSNGGLQTLDGKEPAWVAIIPGGNWGGCRQPGSYKDSYPAIRPKELDKYIDGGEKPEIIKNGEC